MLSIFKNTKLSIFFNFPQEFLLIRKNDETDLSTNFKVNPKNWNNQFKQVFGLTEAPDINKQLSAIKNKIEKIYAERLVLDLDTNSNIIKNIYHLQLD